MPGEGRVPDLGMTWEHYLAAPAPPEHMVGDVECDTVADIVIATLGNFSFAIYIVFSSLIAYLLHVFYCLIVELLIRVFLFDCRPSTGVLRDRRRPRLGLSTPSASAYLETFGTRLGRRLFETT